MKSRIAFLFAGQGAQVVGMGRDLCQASPAARRIFDQADATLGRPLSAVCFDGPLDALTASRNCQPAIYTMSMACLAALTERVPVAPVACGGLSLGEFAAATAAGALGFETGLRLVARRGELMQEACAARRGAMAAVLNADPARVVEACAAAGIDVANYNCPGQIVISGDPERLQAAVASLQAAGGARVIPLQVDGAFHSRLMAPAAEAFAPVLDATPFADPACPLAQNYPGDLVRSGAQIRANLKAQITGSVRWEPCMNAMLALLLPVLVALSRVRGGAQIFAETSPENDTATQ